MRPMNTREFIYALGGLNIVSEALGLKASAVGNWHKRGIPWRWRLAVAELAAARGVEVPADLLTPSAEAA